MLGNVTQRLQALSPQELQILDAAITPQVGQIVMKAFPELAPLVQPLMQAQDMVPQQMQGPAQQMQGPRPAPFQMPGGAALGGMR